MNAYMKSLFTTVMLLLTIAMTSEAQVTGELKGGLASRVYCSCQDSLGNLYTVRPSDSIYIQKWDVSTNTWSRFTTLSRTLSQTQASCGFLNGSFYLTGVDPFGVRSYLYKYNGSWSEFISIKYYNTTTPTRCVKYHNNLYFMGALDSIGFGTYSHKNITVFNGTDFSQASFPANFGTNTGLFGSNGLRGDTMYIISDNRVLYHTFPKFWDIYYAHGTSLTTLATTPAAVYASVLNSNRVIRVTSGAVTGNYVSPNPVAEIFGHRDRVVIRPTASSGSGIIRYINDTGRVANLFRNQVRDSSKYSFVTAGDVSSPRLFYHGEAVKIDGRNYHYIAEMFVDSFRHAETDTVFVSAFQDRNRDYIKTQLDSGLIQPIFRWQEINKLDSASKSTGYALFYPLDNETCNLTYEGVPGNTDSCYAQPFSGSLSTDIHHNPATRDTISFPVWPKSKYSRNLTVRCWSPQQSRARMMDNIQLNINLINQDCNYTFYSSTVTITLEPNTTVVSSFPAYSSIAGNVLTYNLVNLPPQTVNNIKLVVKYSNTDFKLGDIVKHYVKITPGFSEDPAENRDSIIQKLVYSYDPNEKLSEPTGRITSGLKDVRYTIHFQNEGNDDAIRVTVVDTLIKGIPVYEFRMVAASHPYTVSLHNNVVTWTFDDIYLKPKSTDDAASRGYIIFDAKVKSELRVGDSILNKAYIYFDYNSPIITNFAIIHRDEDNSSVSPVLPGFQYLKVYPNPANNFITIANTGNTPQNITIYDVRGAAISSVYIGGHSMKDINTSHWARGLYLAVGEKNKALKLIIE